MSEFPHLRRGSAVTPTAVLDGARDHLRDRHDGEDH